MYGSYVPNICLLHGRSISVFVFSPADEQTGNWISLSVLFSFNSHGKCLFSYVSICRRKTKIKVRPFSFFFRKWTNRKSYFVIRFLLFFVCFCFINEFRFKMDIWLIIRVTFTNVIGTNELHALWFYDFIESKWIDGKFCVVVEKTCWYYIDACFS